MKRYNPDRHFLFCTTVPGLERVAAEEVLELLPDAEITGEERGKVYFACVAPLTDILRLRCADNLYSLISDFTIGNHKVDLKAISSMIEKSDISESLRYLGKPLPKPRLVVSASKTGKKTFSRFEIAQMALNALIKKYGFLEGDTKSHDYAFRLDVNGERGVFSLKLTPPSFRFRGEDREFASGGIRPTIANALVRISAPLEKDVFLDPFCGAGTIVEERCLYPAKEIIASDINSDILGKARKNLPNHVVINCWDVRKIPLPDMSVDAIVTNLPWGKQIKVGSIYGLYVDFVKEVNRLLSADGRVVALTDQDGPLLEAVRANGLNCGKAFTLSLHGLMPSVYLLSRK